MAKTKFNVNINDKDLGFKKIMAEVKKLRAKPYVKMGVQGKSALEKKKSSDGGVQFTSLKAPTVVDIATMHEFGGESKNGAAQPPERSFMRSTFEKNKEKYVAAAEKIKDQILSGKLTTEKGLRILGLMMERDVKNAIRAGIAPPLADSTLRKKNSAAIGKAEATVSKMEATYRAKGKLTKAQKGSLNKASDTILTGGKSVALIDTGQMINSIRSVVEMNMAGGKKEE